MYLNNYLQNNMNSNKNNSEIPMHICVATPCYNGQCHAKFMISLLKLQTRCRDLGVHISFKILTSESLITRARSTLASQVYNEKIYSHLLFLDSDIEFDPDDIIKMILADVDLIGGIYPKKCIVWSKLQNKVIDNNTAPGFVSEFVITTLKDTNITDVNKPVEVKYVGTGLMLIKMKVLEKMIEKFPKDFMHLNKDTELVFRFFDCGLNEDNVYLSEDYWFCERWRSIEGKVYAALWTKTLHWGNYGYVGDITSTLIGMTIETSNSILSQSTVEKKESKPELEQKKKKKNIN